MGHKSSKFALYKKALRKALVRLKWDKDEALLWLNSNIEYTHYLFEDSCPPFKAAAFINKLRSGDAH